MNLFNYFAIRLEQQLYIYLLQRYLRLKYRSEYESHSNLLKLLNILMDLKVLKEMQLMYIKDEEFKDFIPYCGPLAREIYDLKRT